MRIKPRTIALTVLALLLMGVLSLFLVLGTQLSAHIPSAPLSPRQQVEQKAIAMAHGLGLAGQPTRVLALSATRSQVGFSGRCKFWWLVLEDQLSFNQTRMNYCNPNATLWMVRVTGDYASKQPTNAVWVLMNSDGALIEAGSYDFPGWHAVFPYLWERDSEQ